MPIDPELLTVPLSTKRDILLQPFAAPADPFAYNDEIDKAQYESALPTFFQNVFKQLQQQDQLRQAQQQEFDARIAQSGQIDPGLALEGPDVIAQAPVVAPPPISPGMFPGQAEPYAAEAGQHAPMAAPILNEATGGLFGKIGNVAKAALAPVGHAVETGIETAGRGVQALPGGDRVGTAIESLPLAAGQFKKTFGTEFQRKTGQPLNLETALTAINQYGAHPLADLAGKGVDFATDVTIDPLLRAAMPDALADPIIKTLDVAGYVAPYVALTILAPQFGVPLDAAFALSASDDIKNLYSAYHDGTIDGRTFLLGSGLAGLNIIGPLAGPLLGKAMHGFSNADELARGIDELDRLDIKVDVPEGAIAEGAQQVTTEPTNIQEIIDQSRAGTLVPPVKELPDERPPVSGLDEVKRAQAEARAIVDPDEKQRYMQEQGVAKSHEQLAIDRGEMLPGEKPPINLGAERTARAVPTVEKADLPKGDRVVYSNLTDTESAKMLSGKRENAVWTVVDPEQTKVQGVPGSGVVAMKVRDGAVPTKSAAIKGAAVYEAKDLEPLSFTPEDRFFDPDVVARAKPISAGRVEEVTPIRTKPKAVPTRNYQRELRKPAAQNELVAAAKAEPDPIRSLPARQAARVERAGQEGMKAYATKVDAAREIARGVEPSARTPEAQAIVSDFRARLDALPPEKITKLKESGFLSKWQTDEADRVLTERASPPTIEEDLSVPIKTRFEDNGKLDVLRPDMTRREFNTWLDTNARTFDLDPRDFRVASGDPAAPAVASLMSRVARARDPEIDQPFSRALGLNEKVRRLPLCGL